MSRRKHADSDHQLDVELMILDYCTYMANQTIFDDYHSRRPSRNSRHHSPSPNIHESPSHAVQTVNCKPFLTKSVLNGFSSSRSGGIFFSGVLIAIAAFITIFKHHFPHATLPTSQTHRLQLLQLITLLTHRNASGAAQQNTLIHPTPTSLALLRSSTNALAAPFVRTRHLSLPLSRHLLSQLPLPQFMVEPPQEPAILDLLPMFLRLCAGSFGDDQQMTRAWMHLAAEFMLQAALEGLLVRGGGVEYVREAFSWGWVPDGAAGAEGSVGQGVANLFWDEKTGREIAEWGEVREECASLVSSLAPFPGLSDALWRQPSIALGLVLTNCCSVESTFSIRAARRTSPSTGGAPSLPEIRSPPHGIPQHDPLGPSGPPASPSDRGWVRRWLGPGRDGRAVAEGESALLTSSVNQTDDVTSQTRILHG